MKKTAALLFIILALMPLSVSAADTFQLKFEKTPYGEISYPVVVNIPNTSARLKINEDIGRMAKEWNCSFGDDELRKENDTSPVGLSFSSASELKLQGPDYLSFVSTYDYDCGGPYPDTGVSTYTYDLNTGEKIEFETFVRDDFNPEKLMSFLRRHAKTYMPIDDECMADTADFEFYLKPQKVVFRTSFAHAMRACEQEFELPIAKAKSFIRPEIYDRLSKAK